MYLKYGFIKFYNIYKYNNLTVTRRYGKYQHFSIYMI